MSVGLIRGFFGRGFQLSVTSSAQPLALQIDLHRCVGDNLQLFTSVWTSAWHLLQQIDLELPNSKAPGRRNMLWEVELAQALVLVPGALRRCSINSKQEAMLGEAVHSLPQLRFRIRTPPQPVKTEEVPVVLAKAVRDWSRGRWKTFGAELGSLLQELVLLVFPQKYNVDGAGLLRQQLLRANSALSAPAGGQERSPAWATPFLLVALVGLFVAAVVVRAHRMGLLRSVAVDGLQPLHSDRPSARSSAALANGSPRDAVE